MARDAGKSSDSKDSALPELSSLPPGRHGIPREVVERNQRERLIAGAKKAVDERGFAKVTIADVVGHARVSRRTFYEHFANKGACIEAAFGAPFVSLVDSEGRQRFGSPIAHSHTFGDEDSPARSSPDLVQLPPGRHRIPREVVERNQRERLIAGTAKAIEEKGFAKVTIADIVRHAGVSRGTFYEHFANKGECLAAARGISLIPQSEDRTS